MQRYRAVLFLMFLTLTVVLVMPANGSIHAQGINSHQLSYNHVFYSDAVNYSFQHKETAVYCGSGFFITPQIVVTNNHVISGANDIEVVYKNEVALLAVVIGRDEANDLALLKVSGLEDMVSPLVLGNSGGVREGDRVYAVGFPLPMVLGPRAKMSEGIVSSDSGMQGDVKMFQISTPVQPGNSGGPLLNDRAEVIGIVTAGLNTTYMLKQGIAPQNVNYAVKMNFIYNLISHSGLNDSLIAPSCDHSLSAADVMDIARKAVVLINVTKEVVKKEQPAQ